MNNRMAWRPFALRRPECPPPLTRGYADPWTEQLPNNNFDAQNLQFAMQIQTELLQATGMEDRGVQRARFMEVLRGQKRPAILIEAGYLSNPAEAEKIETPRSAKNSPKPSRPRSNEKKQSN